MASSHVPGGGDRRPTPATAPPPPAPEAAEASRAPPRPSAPDPPRPAPDRARRPGRVTRDRLRAKLASRQELRDAYLLHEVLGPPLALRDPDARRPGG